MPAAKVYCLAQPDSFPVQVALPPAVLYILGMRHEKLCRVLSMQAFMFVDMSSEGACSCTLAYKVLYLQACTTNTGATIYTLLSHFEEQTGSHTCKSAQAMPMFDCAASWAAIASQA